MGPLHPANFQLWCYLALILFFQSVARAQVGDVTGVHDPSIIQSGSSFYLFSTGRGIQVRTSTDLFNWKREGHIFDAPPDWTLSFNPNANSLWAPDISFINGEYRLYYAVSSFGKTLSAIGLAVNKTLDRNRAEYKWIDRGIVIQTPAGNNWNAIDPCAFEDADGNAWLALGSCWKGLKLISLNSQTGLPQDQNQTPIAIAANPPTNIVEESYIRRHGDFYYLWESVDHCCRGSASNYRILVGRSKTVRGPYLDFDGKPMLEGGGTLVLASYDKVRGPGSCAIVQAGGQDFLIHHAYDAGNGGKPTLQIRELFFLPDGWPVVTLPITQPVDKQSQPTKSSVGEWLVSCDFAAGRHWTLHQNGSVDPDKLTWHQQGTVLHFSAGTDSTISAMIARDGNSFAGRNKQGQQITGMRMSGDSTH